MKLRFIILLVYFFIVLAETSAVDEKDLFKNVYIGSKVHYGFIIPHHKSIAYLLERHVPGFELIAGRETFGKNIWEQLYRYPRIGIGYFFCDYGNPKVLGQVHALYSYMDIPIITNNADIQLLSYQISFGMSYLTKKFDVYDNYLNTAIGTNFNIYFRLGFDTKIPVSENLEITGEFGFAHCSNGKIRSPNFGLNVLSCSAGINYYMNKTNTERIRLELPQKNKRDYFCLIYSAGAKAYDNLYNKYYFISSLSFDYERHLNLKRRIGVGSDLFYDKSISEALAIDGELNKDIANLFRFGLHGSHTLIYNKILMSVNIGHYLYSKYTDLSLFYSRLALRYKLTNHILLNISLKAHKAKADFIEWGVGYYW